MKSPYDFPRWARSVQGFCDQLPPLDLHVLRAFYAAGVDPRLAAAKLQQMPLMRAAA